MFFARFLRDFYCTGVRNLVYRQFFTHYHEAIRQFGAIMLILFGLITAGVFQPKFMMKERRIHFKHRPEGFIGSVLIGLAFGAGWSPCSGPILGAVFSLAGTNPSSAVPYMFLYVLGFAIPFLVLSFFITRMNWIRKHQLIIMRTGGILMIVIGIMLFFNWMSYILIVLSNLFGGFKGL